MPVINIADVTSAIIQRIKQGLTDSGMWAAIPEVFPDPITSESREGLSFYLYHVRENARFKNTPYPGRDLPPVKLTPMGLDLYYQLTAAKDTLNDGTAAYEEQRMMSAALKALHDTPQLSVDDDKFRLTLQPVPATDAVHNWTAGSLPLKLSAYYEVSVILLEPEPPALYSGRVLLYGNYVFTSGTPRITGSRSIIDLTLPTETTLRQLTAEPGQAAPNGDITFFGTGFNDGTIMLRIFNSKYSENVVTPNWNIRVAAGELTVTIRDTAQLESNGNPIEVLPGMYSAQVVVTKTLEIPGGTIKEFMQSSNQFPFVVTPVVNPGTLAGDVLTVNGSGFQVMANPLLEKEEMQVIVGRHVLSRSRTITTISKGEFRVISTMQLELNLPLEMETGFQPVRVIRSGAESQPAWKEIV